MICVKATFLLLDGELLTGFAEGSENFGRSICISAGCSQPYYVYIKPATEVLDPTFRTEVTFQYASKAPVTEVGFVTNHNGSLHWGQKRGGATQNLSFQVKSFPPATQGLRTSRKSKN
jgi:hypothetical protein